VSPPQHEPEKSTQIETMRTPTLWKIAFFGLHLGLVVAFGLLAADRKDGHSSVRAGRPATKAAPPRYSLTLPPALRLPY
jgi:hypothetical protein